MIKWKSVWKGYIWYDSNNIYYILEKAYAVLCLVAPLCLTLCDPMVALQAPLSMGILQARILEWVAMPSSRESSQPRGQTQFSHIAEGSFTTWAPRKRHGDSEKISGFQGEKDDRSSTEDF